MLEKEVEAYLKKVANKNGFLCYKFTCPSTAGVPDRILMGYGRCFFVELKAPGCKPRDLQKHRITDMREHGMEVYVIDTKEKVDMLFANLLPLRNKKPKCVECGSVF